MSTTVIRVLTNGGIKDIEIEGFISIIGSRDKLISPILNLPETGEISVSVGHKSLLDDMDGFRQTGEYEKYEWGETIRYLVFSVTRDQILNKIINFVLSGQKIRAIRLLRAYTNWGLKESKNFVDFLDDWGISEE